jgi:hypothetical protein
VKKSVIFRFSFLVIISIIITSCYENYLVINSDFKSVKISSDSTKIFFFHVLKAGQPPKGISTFPDGGTQNVIFKNVSLYCYDIQNENTEKIIDFGNLPYESWNYNISLKNNTLIFSICPISGWDRSINHSAKSQEFSNLYREHKGFYKYNITENNISRFTFDGYNQVLSSDENQIVYLKRDSLNVEIWHFLMDENKNQIKSKLKSNNAFIQLRRLDENTVSFKENNEFKTINLITNDIETIDKEFIIKDIPYPVKELKNLTENITFKDWNFDLSEYWQQNKKQYINDIVNLNGNLLYRKAIIESLSETMGKDEFTGIIEQMNKYGESLKGLEKSEYSIYSQETIQLLNQYINSF